MGASLARGAGAAAPAAATCPEDAPVGCAEGCCPAATVCAGSACDEASPAPGVCPDDRPVRCEGSVSCTGATCTAYDASSAGNDATVTAPDSFGEGRFGGSARLGADSTDALDSCQRGVSAATGGFPAGDAPLTFEAWVRSRSGYGTIFSYGSPETGRWRALVVGSFWLSWRSAPLSGVCQFPTSSLFDGQWHFLAATYGTGQALVYLDGQPLGVPCATGPLDTLSGTRLVLGRGVGPPASVSCFPFQGDIDEVRVLASAASSTQIAADFAGGPLRAIDGTVGLWHFDEGAGARCCPAGSKCGPGGACAADPTGASACPADAPVACEGGKCCPAGTTCNAEGCAVTAAGASACPQSAPEPCGGGLCCPSGWSCSAGRCTFSQPPAAPEPVCPGYTVDRIWIDSHFCCPFAGLGGGLAMWGSTLYCRALAPCAPACNCCGAGYGCSGSAPELGCVATPTPMQCPSGRSPCDSASSTDPDGCCPEGSTCTSGYCCPAGMYPGISTCCPFEMLQPDGTCSQPPASALCPEGQAVCGDSCCPAGTTCSAGFCIQEPPRDIICHQGIPCGNFCCPLLSRCTAGGCAHAAVAASCSPQFPSVCAGGGICCRAGFQCSGRGTCTYTGSQKPLNHPPGPQSGEGWCAQGEVAVADGCCPADHPGGCGQSCCLSGAACADGDCECPEGRLECGDWCCGAGALCAAGQCGPRCDDPDFPTRCGTNCCRTGIECRGGTCVCPDDFPVECGDLCCPAGAPCESGGCGCPEGRLPCSTLCCSEGKVCDDDGRCVEAPEEEECMPGHSPQKCPDATTKCCNEGLVCCVGEVTGEVGCFKSEPGTVFSCKPQ